MSGKNYAISFVCDKCGAEIGLREHVNLCPFCGGLLEVCYDLAALRKDGARFYRGKVHSIWRYDRLMPPVRDRKNIVTLGEGGTPLIRSKYLGPSLGTENLYFKNDTVMPTGSFKDRGYSLAVSYATDIGIKDGFTYSSGNAGTSFAAYSRRAGFNSTVLVEYLSSDTKKAMIMLYGANAAELHFDSFAQIAEMLDRAITELKLYQFVNFMNPIRHEGMKTFAYEIFEQLKAVPDYSFHPMGTGGGVYGTWKGFKELREIGVTDKVPRMVAVQPECVAWLKEAIDGGADEGRLFGDSTRTIAQSICGNSPLQGGRRLINCIRASGGFASAVSDEEILQAMRDAAQEGLGIEPSSAAAVAAFKKAVCEGRIKSSDTVVCVLTGSALKQPAAVIMAAGKPEKHISADVGQLGKLLGVIPK